MPKLFKFFAFGKNICLRYPFRTIVHMKAIYTDSFTVAWVTQPLFHLLTQSETPPTLRVRCLHPRFLRFCHIHLQNLLWRPVFLWQFSTQYSFSRSELFGTAKRYVYDTENSFCVPTREGGKLEKWDQNDAEKIRHTRFIRARKTLVLKIGKCGKPRRWCWVLIAFYFILTRFGALFEASAHTSEHSIYLWFEPHIFKTVLLYSPSVVTSTLIFLVRGVP